MVFCVAKRNVQTAGVPVPTVTAARSGGVTVRLRKKRRRRCVVTGSVIEKGVSSRELTGNGKFYCFVIFFFFFFLTRHLEVM